MNRSPDERGQVLSSLVAVLAVVAIVGGLLVLFGTRGNDSVADSGQPAGKTTPKPSGGPSASTPVQTGRPAAPVSSVPVSSVPVSSVPTTKPSAPASTPPPVPASTPASEAPSVPPSSPASIPAANRPAVEVYNNTTRKGLAEDVAIRARQVGWIVTGQDNWRGKIVSSTVYFPAGMQAEANQLARDIGVSRTKEALPNMKKDRLSVILTTDYAG
ncbi:LytR C-terminal domain-containing protein [Kribbella sp. CA-293567]|uniref:LytR C-terminal domain-containing protein n=1 Tax=Kribbella sp. CA-293567 TaxID=3002436 RepID=UPI0022DE2730|nr:LytR C-terminal domain-containing protein [Kribbella sp. CA-293567]WBQ04266.1 LytR C-terminal domain-containing protein [Kribbella sp. CA-293567]